MSRAEDWAAANAQKIAHLEAINAELLEALKKIGNWLGRQAEHEEQQAATTRFGTMKDAYAADAKNHRKMLADIDTAIAHATGGQA